MSHHLLDPDRWNLDHREALLRFGLQRISDYGTAEDLVQETLLSAWNARRQFRGECSERTWLTGILRNKIVDHYRRSARRPAILATDLESEARTEGGTWIERQADERRSPGPVAALERREFMRDLESALALLPGRMAEAFRLREIEGLGTDEIVERLGITRSNLWVLVHRAKQSLAESLGSRWSLSEGFGGALAAAA
jgi:RNA polymerase sigma-70 factor (TIGR02943 family)